MEKYAKFSVADMFTKFGEDRPKVRQRTATTEEILRNMSIKNTYGIGASRSTTIRNQANDFSKLVADDITNVRLVNPDNKNEIYSFDKAINNRVKYFYYGKDQKKYNYSEITKVEKLEDTNGYGDLKDYLHCNNFYSLYVKNEFNPNKEDILCVLCFKK